MKPASPTPPPAPSFAIVSEAFFKCTPAESEALDSYESGYARLHAQGLGVNLRLVWSGFVQSASDGDAAALARLERFPTQESYVIYETARSTGEWANFTKQCVARWPELEALARRARAHAEQRLSEYRNRPRCPFRIELGLPARESDDVVTCLIGRVISACHQIEDGAKVGAQITEPPRPRGYFGDLLISI